eukprot:3368109-Amphidinium_carterae.1
MGLDLERAPPIALQLRALGETGLSQPHAAEIIDSHGGLWRSNGVMLDCLLSLSLCRSDRLYIGGRSASELGLAVYFCDQTGKYAMTSRTRVGRYLDDQPARVPRAHVFGALRHRSSKPWVPAGSLGALAAEKCPMC